MKPETAANGRENARVNGTLSPKQEAAALALAAGGTEEEAAKESGAGARTIRTWLHEEAAFARRIKELRSAMTSRALGRLVDNMASAAETLAYLSRKGKSEMVRLSAARAVLELGNKQREAAELEERLQELEKQLAGRGRQQWQSRAG
jgi:hypothetical protein